MPSIAELKDLNQQQNDENSCGRTEQVLSQLGTDVSQIQTATSVTDGKQDFSAAQ